MAVCLALVCAFYLSFSAVVRHYDNKAKEYAAGDDAMVNVYLDSIATQKVWFGYTLKECRAKEINLGLDLKGGMNVIMEVSVPDILRSLSGNNTSALFTQAMQKAYDMQRNGDGRDFVILRQQHGQGEPHVPDARNGDLHITFLAVLLCLSLFTWPRRPSKR